jgi:hypothetical protein
MFENHLFRCSALGKLMTNDRSGKAMGDTCKSYLKEIYRERKWGLKKNIQSKYIEKGLMVEDQAIAFFSTVKGQFYIKNDEWLKNEFISGTPDLITDGSVIDIKSSWDAFTFPSKDDKINKDYFYQLQGYMWLTGKETAVLSYVLLDTPEQLIQDELRRLAWKMGVMDDANSEYIEACEQVRKQMTFNQIPIEERIVTFDIQRSEQDIEAIKLRVQEAREWLIKYEETQQK